MVTIWSLEGWQRLCVAKSSNTAKNSAPGRPFVKGDPRINRKGRPKSFDALRELAQQISHEEALSGGQPLIIDGHKVTVAEAILRQLAQSKNPKERQLFIEIAFGKVPTAVEMAGKNGGPIQVEHSGETHGSIEHIAAVVATLAGVGAIQLPGHAGGDPAEDDQLHTTPADA